MKKIDYFQLSIFPHLSLTGTKPADQLQIAYSHVEESMKVMGFLAEGRKFLTKNLIARAGYRNNLLLE